MFSLLPYGRIAAVRYAHRWAFSRNQMFFNYDNLGGDCTNFVSQCIYAGGGIMNYTPTYGWYYIDANQKAPAWTGVPYLYNFLTRREVSVGPIAKEVTRERILPGDIIQLSFDGISWQHSPIVVFANHAKSDSEILLAAHSEDADYRPLDTYSYQKIRFLHILGIYFNSRYSGK